MQKFPVTLFSVGCTLLTVALITGWIIIPLCIHYRVENEISLINGTIVGDEWSNPDQNVYMKMYIFNVTNPEEIEAGGEPLVDELGPYVYREIRVKKILDVNVEKDSIRYIEDRTYFFEEELSNGREDDVFCTVNVPYLAVVQELATYSTMIRWLASTYITKFKSTIFINLSVKEFIFDGIYQPMIYEIEQITGQRYLPNSTYGIFYGKNGSSYGEMEIYSGVRDSSRIGETISWRGKTKLDAWPEWHGDHCNMLNGSDGTVYPPFVTKKSTLYFFNPELCRSAHLTYNRDEEVMGIPTYLFTPPLSLTRVDNPDNFCFCLEKNLDDCPRDGVHQLKPCQHNGPILMSFPHFLDAHPKYIKKFGFQPDNELHESQIFVEPTTGIPLRLRLRIQLNADIKRLPNDSKFRRIQDLVFPLMWIDESYVMNERNLEKMRQRLITPLEAIEWTKWFACGCSLGLILLSTFIFIIRVRRKSVFV